MVTFHHSHSSWVLKKLDFSLKSKQLNTPQFNLLSASNTYILEKMILTIIDLTGLDSVNIVIIRISYRLIGFDLF